MGKAQIIIQQTKQVKKSDLENLIANYLYNYIYKQYKNVEPEDIKKYFCISMDSIYVRVNSMDVTTDGFEKFCTKFKEDLERDVKKFSKKISNISFGNLDVTNSFIGSVYKIPGDSKVFLDYFEIACAYEIIND